MSASLRDLGRRADALPTTHFDATDLMRQAELRLRRRRLAAAACAAIAVVVVLGTALLAGPDTRDADPPPAGPPSDHPASDHWVLVGGELLVGADEYKGDWSEPLPKHGVRTYPDFMSADPATHRFLVIANPDVTAWNVMTPGQREPLATVTCASAGCHAVALGPGPDELTMRSSGGVLVVIGPDGRTRRELGPAWTNAALGQGFLHDEAWSPDGSSWAETRYEQRPDKASLTVLLRDPDSPDVTTLYRYSEPAPPWYHGGQRGDAGKLPGWGAPYVIDLQWTPDSTRLAFITMTVRELAHRPAGTTDGYQLRLFVADTTTGKVDQFADLGRCACNGYSPHLAWTPDGQSLTVFSHSTLIHYDLTGKQLDSAVADPPMGGPLAWLETE